MASARKQQPPASQSTYPASAVPLDSAIRNQQYVFAMTRCSLLLSSQLRSRASALLTTDSGKECCLAKKCALLPLDMHRIGCARAPLNGYPSERLPRTQRYNANASDTRPARLESRSSEHPADPRDLPARGPDTWSWAASPPRPE